MGKITSGRKRTLGEFPETFQKKALIPILKMIKDIRLVKRSQALLGSNLTRDNQKQ